MIHSIVCKNLFDDNSTSFKFEDINECPKCKAKIYPKCLFGVCRKTLKNTQYRFDILCYCPNCTEPFIITYSSMSQFPSLNSMCISKIEPCYFNKQDFDKKLSNISPLFVEIYNQSLQAETLGLHHIAGMGYRKSLEFLIKDFAIRENPEAIEKIEKSTLSSCIKEYIDSKNIKTLATKTAWIGNDETHYIKKHTERDFKDMKNFIQAIVYYISMELTVDDAETIDKA